jgi:hypothetical protein
MPSFVQRKLLWEKMLKAATRLSGPGRFAPSFAGTGNREKSLKTRAPALFGADPCHWRGAPALDEKCCGSRLFGSDQDAAAVPALWARFGDVFNCPGVEVDK